jgi:hypothetical protein
MGTNVSKESAVSIFRVRDDAPLSHKQKFKCCMVLSDVTIEFITLLFLPGFSWITSDTSAKSGEEIQGFQYMMLRYRRSPVGNFPQLVSASTFYSIFAAISIHHSLPELLITITLLF